MRVVSLSLIWLAALSPVAASATIDSSAAATAPASHDMCTTPAGWAKPFTHVYHLRNGAKLVFVGVEHTDDITDETHRQIKAAVEHYRPGFVLVDGVSSAKSGFDWYLKDIANLARHRTDGGAASENLYAVKLALDSGAHFSGWDFSPDQDYKVLVEDKVAIADALGAHLLRSKVNPFDRESAASSVERQVRYAATVAPVASFDYAAWYRQAYGEQYDPANGTPCGKGIGSRVVKDLSYRRNLNLTSLIEAHAQPGQTLLVEAGANHWLALKDWLATRSLASS